MKENHIPEGSVISAGYQSAGRGQKGNSWESSEGKNLLISIILYPSIINKLKVIAWNKFQVPGVCKEVFILVFFGA